MHKAELRKLLCAMLLGDGCVEHNNNQKRNGNQNSFWFSFNHSMKQVDWAKQKKEMIDYFFNKKKVTRKSSFVESIAQFNKSNGKTYYGCRYRLYWSQYMRVFHKWVYRSDGTKRAKFLLNQIDSDKHLAIWFMDDGSQEYHNNTHIDGTSYKTNPRLMLHVCSFTMEDVEYMAGWFKEKYEVEPRIIYTSRKQGRQPRLRFTAKDSRKLFRRITVYVKQTETGKKKFSLCLERY